MKTLSPAIQIPERPTFRGLNLENSWVVPTYRRSLPHLHLNGAIYFVTFRLADSIPISVAERWLEECDYWLGLHGADLTLAKNDPQGWHSAYSKIPRIKQQAMSRSWPGHMKSEQFFEI
ncbi:MAG: hypothetical protein H0T62_03100 [Parachlamydiaceae bacterium]|nr:hypothetical protein [Parachlamydiaceae bacterium]